MSDARQIEADIYERLSKVIDPELGRSVADLGMIAAIEAAPASSDTGTYDVTVHVELTVPGCPLERDHHQPDQWRGQLLSGRTAAAPYRSRFDEP